ncbi:MAG: hypothetical protein IJP08_09270, partial [Bacteroidaceae bacterium]|nr:hypothetical protein [Bacteroidaceae bacterium]
MKQLLTYLTRNILLCILCAVCCSCAQQKHQVTPLAEELILLDDSLFFIPEEQNLIPLFEKLDSFDR